MNLLFSVKNQVNVFNVYETLSSTDFQVLRSSLVRFFESKPEFVVLDMSFAELAIDEDEMQRGLSELKTIASSLNISFTVAQTDFESIHAQSRVVAAALHKKIELLESRLQLQSEVKSNLKSAMAENAKLRDSIKNQPKAESSKAPFSPIVERLWSEKP